MTADQLKKALEHFSTRRIGFNPFDHMLEMGEPERRIAIDVQLTCATAIAYIADLEPIAQAYSEEKPHGPRFIQMLTASRLHDRKVWQLEYQIQRQATMIREMNERLAAAGG